MKLNMNTSCLFSDKSVHTYFSTYVCYLLKPRSWIPSPPPSRTIPAYCDGGAQLRTLAIYAPWMVDGCSPPRYQIIQSINSRYLGSFILVLASVKSAATNKGLAALGY